MPWYDELPEDVQKLDIVKNSPDQETYYKRLGDQQNYIGQAIRIPGEEAGDEDWNSFNEKLQSKVPTLMQRPDFDDEEQRVAILREMGYPEEVDGYKVPELKADEGVQVNTELQDTFKNLAHKHGLTQKQYEGVLSDFHNQSLETVSQQIQAFKEDRGKLKAEWGSAYDDKLSKLKVFLEKTEAPETATKVLSEGSSELLKWMSSLSSLADKGGKPIVPDENDPQPGRLTPEEAKIKIAEIRRNDKHPYHHINDPGYKAAKARMRELYLMADPQNAAKPV